MEHSLAFSEKITRITVWFSKFSSGYILKSIEKRIIMKYLYTYSYFRITHNSQNVEATQESINRRMDKQMWHIWTMEYYSALKRKCSGGQMHNTVNALSTTEQHT